MFILVKGLCVIMDVRDTELFYAVISKNCNGLLSEEKNKRRKALEQLTDDILKEHSGLSVDEKFNRAFKHILRCFNDKVEAVREAAVILVQQTLPMITNIDENQYLPFIIAILTQRIGSPETVETSEEVRLLFVSLLRVIIKKYQSKVAPYLNDCIEILAKTIVDSYPKVKIESCECALELAHATPQHFRIQSESLVKPLMLCFKHQHYKVRVSAITCIGEIIRYGSNKSVDEVCGPLAECLFDQTPMVRKAVLNIIGVWLLYLPDRYSFFHKLLPIILTSLSDELPENQQAAMALWESAGMQYMSENEKELRDQMDFLIVPPKHYPDGVLRSNLGCRTLVSRHLSKIVPPLIRELCDWLPDIRVKSCQLLCLLLLHAENQMIHHLEKLLAAMYKAACDEDNRMMQYVEQAGEYIGYFVPCETYWPLVFPTIEDNTSSGHLRVLAAIVRGTESKALFSININIGEFISRDSVCRSKEPEHQQQVLRVCEALMTVSKKDCDTISQQLFTVLVTVHGLATSQTIVEKTTSLLSSLSELCSGPLYELHVPFLLQTVCKTAHSWTKHSSERYIFEVLLSNSGPVVGRCLNDIISTLITVLHPDKDAQLRLKCFMVLSALLNNHETTFLLVNDPAPHLTSIVKDVISPSLVWHSGRSAEAIRTAAVCCLVVALQSNYFTDKPTLEDISRKLTPLLLSLVEDTSHKTRLHSLAALRHLTSLMQSYELFTSDILHQIYPVVLRSLDDTAEDCRAASVKTLMALFSRAPIDYNHVAAQTHFQFLFNAMLVHLDDSDPIFQIAVLDVLKKIGRMCPHLLLEKVNISKQNFRNKIALEELVVFLESHTD